MNKPNHVSVCVAVCVILVVGFGLMFSGCEHATKTYRTGTATMAQFYETANANAERQFDAQQASLLATYVQKKDVELSVDLKSLAYQAQLNPIIWSPAAIAVETGRLNALHDQKIAEYKESLAAFSALRTKNEATNLTNARKLRDVLNPPPLPTAPVDLSAPITNASGTPTPAPIFQPAK